MILVLNAGQQQKLHSADLRMRQLPTRGADSTFCGPSARSETAAWQGPTLCSTGAGPDTERLSCRSLPSPKTQTKLRRRWEIYSLQPLCVCEAYWVPVFGKCAQIRNPRKPEMERLSTSSQVHHLHHRPWRISWQTCSGAPAARSPSIRSRPGAQPAHETDSPPSFPESRAVGASETGSSLASNRASKHSPRLKC